MPRRVVPVVVLTVAILLVLLAVPTLTASAAPPPLPGSIATIGDSITRGFDSCCWYGDHPSHSWSTGYSSWDRFKSHYERIRDANPAIDGREHDNAVTGAKMASGPGQAAKAVQQQAQYVTILLGANDLCTRTVAGMTPTATFTEQFTQTMETLRGLPSGAHVFVSSIPNLYQLWQVLSGNGVARFVWRTAKICQSMLAESNTEADRQAVLARERELNGALRDVCARYPGCRFDAGLTVFGYPFSASQVSKLDYFHPDLSGQGALAEVTWNASWWGPGV